MTRQNLPQRFTSESATIPKRQQDEKGEWWLSPASAAKHAGHLASTLCRWSRGKGCPALGKRLKRRAFKMGTGHWVYYYSLAQLDEILEAKTIVSPNAGHQGFCTLEEGQRVYKVARNTQLRLIEAGRLGSKEGPGIDKNGRRCRPRVLVCVQDLQRYREKRYGQDDAGELMTIAEAAELLGRTNDSMRCTVHRQKLKTRPAKAFYGKKRLPRSGKLLYRVEVEALQAKRQQKPARLCEYRDEQGLWLPGRLARERYGFAPENLVSQSRTRESSWYLDGRAKDNDPLPPPDQRRKLRCKVIPNRGRGQKKLYVYHNGDLQIMYGRAKGMLSAEQAHVQATQGLHDEVTSQADISVTMRGAESRTNGSIEANLPQAPYPVYIVQPAEMPIPMTLVHGTESTSSCTPSSQRGLQTPRWDEETSTLYWREISVKAFNRHPAYNQRELIEAFHRADWKRAIPNPFANNPRKLQQTITDLMRTVPANTICFRGDGMDRVLWEPAE